MQKNVQCLLLKNDKVIIAEVVEVTSDIGQPDCKLVKPFEIVQGDDNKDRFVPWLSFTEQDVILIRSDDVFTFVEPAEKLLDWYLKNT